MSASATGIRASALTAKAKWDRGRQQIRLEHDQGTVGTRISRLLSELQDIVLLDLYQAALQDVSSALQANIAVVLLGGSGRREIAPFSDVDIMLLYQGVKTEELIQFSQRFFQDISDAGFDLGHSVRTVRDACRMSLDDAYIYSALTAARYLVGNEELFDNFAGRFRRIASRRTLEIIKAIIAAREKERIEFGETVYLLRPNIKRSRGGLRDIHLIRWLGFVQYEVTEIDQLLQAGAISTADSTQLALSLEFLLRVRNEMHFNAGRPEDLLGRKEQPRLADFFGYQKSDAVLSVENFMRDYFRFTSRVRYICDHFVNKAVSRKPSSMLAKIEFLGARQIDEKFWIGVKQIGVNKTALPEVQMDLEQVLRLMQLACLHQKKIEHGTWIAIRHAMLKYPEITVTSDAARRFMALLSNTKGLPDSLYRLHEMQVLSKLIPPFDHARGLLQFNEYHRYTVDEHTLRAVKRVVEFAESDSILGRTYSGIRDKNVLHLAILLHDLGKGYPGDHSDVGAALAEKIGIRLALPDETIEEVKYLVQHHLVMSHLAFHRDINDPALVAEFASNIASVHLLTMLYVLTCADIAAVGPNALSPWKLGLLTDLYLHAKTILLGRSEDTVLDRFRMVHESVANCASDESTKEWLLTSSRNLPISFCVHRPHQRIAEDLLAIKQLTSGQAWCRVRRLDEPNVFELCVAKFAHRRSGIFYRLTGLLSSLSLEIRTADIKHLQKDLIFYWIQAEDQEYQETSDQRLQEVETKAKNIALGLDDSPPKFRKFWKRRDNHEGDTIRSKIEVKFNNLTVDFATIIDVFAYNKIGLLCIIVKKIYALGLDITFSRVATYAHRVVGVFYVTDGLGNKIRNRNQLQIIRREILDAVTEFLEND